VSVLAAQGLCKLFVLRLQAVPAGRVQHTCVDEKGLEVSLCCLLEDLLVQREVSHGSLQPGVLLFKLLEPSHLVDVETAVLLAPGVVGVKTIDQVRRLKKLERENGRITATITKSFRLIPR
jgi:hypothetical protein